LKILIIMWMIRLSVDQKGDSSSPKKNKEHLSQPSLSYVLSFVSYPVSSWLFY